MLQILIWAVVGLGVGTYGTLVGAGGGFIMVPIFLLVIPGIRPAEATGTSLMVVLFNALSGTGSYLRQKRVDLRTGTIFGLATVPGALIGSFVSKYFAARPFYIAFGLFLVAIAIFLNVRPDPKKKQFEELTCDVSGLCCACMFRLCWRYCWPFKWYALLACCTFTLVGGFLDGIDSVELKLGALFGMHKQAHETHADGSKTHAD